MKSWTTFAGCVLVVAVLYWAQALLVPFSLALLLTFVLAPPVVWLQRRIGRVPAVLSVVILVFTFLGLSGWGVVRQMSSLSADLPAYRANIRAKVHDIQGFRYGESLSKFEKALTDLQRDFGGSAPAGTKERPLVVRSEPVTGWSAMGWLGPVLGPLGTAVSVVVLVLFMLLEREDLRNRLLSLVGHGHLAVTTKALDEAGTRVSRQLLMQTVVNIIYGSIATAGLWWFGVPYPLFWGAMGAALRFIPYLGPIAGATGPILIAFAALPGWRHPLEVAALYGVLEVFTNVVLETVLYAGAIGVSQVALMISVAFWTWLWGPLGLLMATPLTVCLVVLGKHVPGLEFLGTLLSDSPPLTPENSYYQRLLARDQAEAAELMERHVKAQSADSVYDALLIPALNYAERDRLEGRLSPDEETAVVETTGELLDSLADVPPPPEAAVAAAPAGRILGYPANGPSDELALRMLAQLLSGLPLVLEITTTRVRASELVEHVRAGGYSLIVIADLPPSAPSRTRYLIRKLRAAFPDLRISVGRWSHTSMADESSQPLTAAGASHVAATLAETRKYLTEAEHHGSPAVARAVPAA